MQSLSGDGNKIRSKYGEIWGFLAIALKHLQEIDYYQLLNSSCTITFLPNLIYILKKLLFNVVLWTDCILIVAYFGLFLYGNERERNNWIFLYLFFSIHHTAKTAQLGSTCSLSLMVQGNQFFREAFQALWVVVHWSLFPQCQNAFEDSLLQ